MIRSVIAQEIIIRPKLKNGNMASTHAGLFSGTDTGPPTGNHENTAAAITNDIVKYANATFKIPIKTFDKVLMEPFFVFINSAFSRDGFSLDF